MPRCGFGHEAFRIVLGSVLGRGNMRRFGAIAFGVSSLLVLLAVVPTRSSGAGADAAAGMFSWQPTLPPVSPPPTANGAMAYDPALRETVLFGGTPGTFGNTWGWDGTTWSVIASNGPDPRQGIEMAYDARTANLVLFGGVGVGGPSQVAYSDTWTFDGTWHREHPTVSPPFLTSYAMAYDTATGTVVLTGGGGRIGNDATWIWDGTTWSRTASVPFSGGVSGLYGASMSYVPAVRSLVLFGGFDLSAHPKVSSATWEWNGRSWSELKLSPSPPARENASSTYDSSAGGLVLFGGYEPSLADNGFGNDTWIFDGTRWSFVKTIVSPEPRVSAQFADGVVGPPLLFGGYDSTNLANSGYLHDTWTLQG